MGKLLIETVDIPVEVITESSKDGKEQRYKIRGIMLQSEIKNKNGRFYPRALMENSVETYRKEKVIPKRAWGQLEHAVDPAIHLDRVSHIITELEMRGNDGWGVAELLDDTPMGRIAIALTKKGVIGTSTRGIGTMTPDGVVEEGFVIAALDLVADPSAPRSLVEAVRESKEWIIGSNGEFIEAPMQSLINNTDKKFTDDSAAMAMNSFFSEINNRLTLKRMVL